MSNAIFNLIRYGVVEEAKTDRVKVKVGDVVTDWVPYFDTRAGSTTTHSQPSKGEQGMLFSPAGNYERGAFLAGLHSDSNKSPSQSAKVDKIVFADGSSVTYDAGANSLEVDVKGAGIVTVNCKTATLNASDSATVNTKASTVNATNTAAVNTKVATVTAETSVTVDSPISTFTGEVLIEGLLTFEGGMVGSGSGSGATMAIQGDMNLIGNAGFSGGAFTHNNVDVGSTHKHTDSIGGQTSTPN
jgi:phage baseplate assembly protein V